MLGPPPAGWEKKKKPKRQLWEHPSPRDLHEESKRVRTHIDLMFHLVILRYTRSRVHPPLQASRPRPLSSALSTRRKDYFLIIADGSRTDEGKNLKKIKNKKTAHHNIHLFRFGGFVLEGQREREVERIWVTKKQKKRTKTKRMMDSSPTRVTGAGVHTTIPMGCDPDKFRMKTPIHPRFSHSASCVFVLQIGSS